jgi:sulfatase modifying factor 1
MMGCSPGDSSCEPTEKPSHRVRLTKGFWMAETPVTAAAWKKFRIAKGAKALPSADGLGRKDLNEASPDDSIPVVFVTWDEAHSFCGWADMRLPSEAEWEYAARAGTAAKQYGNLSEIAWFADNTGRKPIDSNALFESDRKNFFQHLYDNGNRPQPVGKKAPNAWGLHDMLGNVWEWVADWYGEKYYGESPETDPPGPASGTQHVLRGGSWYNFPVLVRVSTRGASNPTERLAINGFRCAGN